MNLWLWAGALTSLSLLPCAAMCLHGSAERRLVGMEMTGLLVVLILVMFTVGFDRSSFIDLPLTLAVMTFGGGLVFARFLEKHL